MLTLAIIILAFIFTVIYGFHDGSNVVATVVTSRSLRPRQALVLACVAEFIGAIGLGSAVARTLGRGLFAPAVLHHSAGSFQVVLLGALLSAIIWDLVTGHWGLPTSSSHALMGGLVGGGIMLAGIQGILWATLLWRVVMPMLVAPFLAFVVALLLMKFLLRVLRNFSPRLGHWLKKAQIFSVALLAASHGSNAAQMGMGMVVLALGAGVAPFFQVPLWVKLICASAITGGLLVGGRGIMRTVGRQVSRLTPLHSLNSQLVSGMMVCGAARLGCPVSVTQIVAPSVMGAGAARRPGSVHWGLAKSIGAAWLITIPATATIAAAIVLLLRTT